MHEPGLSASRQSGNLFAPLQFLYLIAMLFVLAGILTAAMVLQYGAGEVPCPLCLLQRMAMFGVCFGVMLQLRYGPSFRFSGIGLLFAIVLLIISVRQTLLDIYPRPGHEYIGSTVFGLHMPVWSILIALALIAAFAVQMMVWGGRHGQTIAQIKNLRSSMVLALYWLFMCWRLQRSTWLQSLCNAVSANAIRWAMPCWAIRGNEARQTVFTACHPFFTHFKMAACLRLLARKCFELS
ncbi:disulfide bond formation protein b [Brucella melitensis]